MILDTLENSEKYTGLNTGLAEGFDFLAQAGLEHLDDGKYEISGDRVFALVQQAAGRTVAEAQLEGHRKFLDIQYVISGNESMGWAPRAGLLNSMEYDPDRDLEFFKGTPISEIHVPPGAFTIFLPSDAHLPLIGDGPIHKVVVKVAID